MSVEIDEALEDAESALLTAKKYPAELNENGTTAEDLLALEAQIAVVRKQTVGQQNAKTDAKGATKEQNDAVARSTRFIKRVKLMAESVFKKDKQMLSAFHVKQAIPTTVKSLATELDYLKDVAATNKGKLAKKGLKDADLEKMTALKAELTGKDVNQENKKRTGTDATKQRNAAVDMLNDMVIDVRISAELAFADDASKLNEFKTLFPHRATKKTTTETTAKTTATKTNGSTNASSSGSSAASSR
jgi:hypothetical protein